MSRFTTEVRYICETLYGLDKSVGFGSVDEILNDTASKVFDFEFPIFDEAYRLVLEKNILRHFYTREIGEETVGLWKLRLNAKMNEIMPYYNELYKSSLLQFNPLYDVDYKTLGDSNRSSNVVENFKTDGNENLTHTTTTDTETASGKDTITDNPLKYTKSTKNSGVDNENNKEENLTENKGSSSNNEAGKTKYRNSDTPQGGLNMGDIDGNVYLTTAEIDDSLKNSNNNSENKEKRKSDASKQSSYQNNTEESLDYEEGAITETEYGKVITKVNNYGDSKTDGRTSNNIKDIKDANSYITRVVGKQGGMSFARMILEFRETFLKIDLMIIDELNGLFFGLYE